MTKPLVQDEQLTAEVLDQMDPKLVLFYSELAPAISSPVASLVNKALPLRIHPNRILKYAFLNVLAERYARGDEISREHAVRSKHELEAALHAFPSGYDDQEEARRLYRCGRQARQQIGTSLDSLLSHWKRVEHVVQTHRSSLPAHQIRRFSDDSLARVQKLLHDMHRATILDDQYVRENDPRWPASTAQTYLWWWFVLPRYRGKWNDMHRLAVTWRLSDAESVETFRNIVGRLRKKVKSLRYPFGSALESILSEKS